LWGAAVRALWVAEGEVSPAVCLLWVEVAAAAAAASMVCWRLKVAWAWPFLCFEVMPWALASSQRPPCLAEESRSRRRAEAEALFLEEA